MGNVSTIVYNELGEIAKERVITYFNLELRKTARTKSPH
jgi:hypothetical protein